MKRRWITLFYLLASPALAALQAPQPQENLDVGSLLADSKQPCDGEKPKPVPTPNPKVAAAETNEKAVQGLMSLGLIPAEKQEKEPTKKALGALPGPMENCK